MKLLTSLVLCLSASSLFSQELTIIEPSVEVLETVSVDGVLNTINDNADYSASQALITRKMSAVVAAQQEAWIPLGIFENGGVHQLIINSTGGSANSSMSCEFSIRFNSRVNEYRLVHSSSGSLFQLYSYKSNKHFGLVLKYINVNNKSRDNFIEVTHLSGNEGLWAFWNLDVLNSEFINQTEEFQESRRFKASIQEVRTDSGTTPNAYGQVSGIEFHEEVRFSESVTLEGDVIIAQTQGDVSMGSE